MDEIAPGSARLVLQPGVRLLRPDEQLFEAMTKGWRHQQLARHLAFETIDARVRMVARFQAFTNSYPWQWSRARRATCSWRLSRVRVPKQVDQQVSRSRAM